MTDDLAAENAALRAELERLRGAPGAVTRPEGADRTFYRQDLADAAFYRAHRDEIHAALRAGRILDDPSRPDWRTTGGPTPAARQAALSARKAGAK